MGKERVVLNHDQAKRLFCDMAIASLNEYAVLKHLGDERAASALDTTLELLATASFTGICGGPAAEERHSDGVITFLLEEGLPNVFDSPGDEYIGDCWMDMATASGLDEETTARLRVRMYDTVNRIFATPIEELHRASGRRGPKPDCDTCGQPAGWYHAEDGSSACLEHAEEGDTPVAHGPN